MQRNWDLIRDILSQLERRPEAVSLWPANIPGYDQEQVAYHIWLLRDAGLVFAECQQQHRSLHCIAHSLTWAGHELLDGIRPDTAWNNIKRGARERGLELSFDTIKALAQKLVESLLQ